MISSVETFTDLHYYKYGASLLSLLDKFRGWIQIFEYLSASKLLVGSKEYKSQLFRKQHASPPPEQIY